MEKCCQLLYTPSHTSTEHILSTKAVEISLSTSLIQSWEKGIYFGRGKCCKLVSAILGLNIIVFEATRVSVN